MRNDPRICDLGIVAREQSPRPAQGFAVDPFDRQRPARARTRRTSRRACGRAAYVDREGLVAALHLLRRRAERPGLGHRALRRNSRRWPVPHVGPRSRRTHSPQSACWPSGCTIENSTKPPGRITRATSLSVVSRIGDIHQAHEPGDEIEGRVAERQDRPVGEDVSDPVTGLRGRRGLEESAHLCRARRLRAPSATSRRACCDPRRNPDPGRRDLGRRATAQRTRAC